MKTPIEKLIDYLDKYNEVFGMAGLSIRDRASILLEEEKKNIIDAHVSALSQFDKIPSRLERAGLEYFNTTFKK